MGRRRQDFFHLLEQDRHGDRTYGIDLPAV